MQVRFASTVGWAAVPLAAVGLLNPARARFAVAGAVLAILAAACGRGARSTLVPALLALMYALGALCGSEFRGDSVGYFASLRSAAFDHDIDFSNEWEHWGYEAQPRTATGLIANLYPVGPAIVWSPFYALGHAYVTSGLGGRYPADGFSAPYRRAAGMGTMTVVALAIVLITGRLARQHGPAIAALAVGATFGATSLAYYALIVPTMAHGVVFAAIVLYLHAWELARERPDPGRWAALGACVGLVTLMRWQAVVTVLLAVPLAVEQLRTRRLRGASLLAAAAAGAAVFFPQMAAWKILYGTWLRFPQGPSYVDWSSPHLLDTLVSADHGLLNWTPLVAVGLVGIVLLLRTDRVWAIGALMTVGATAWVNGGVKDWAGSDAFGARRYDVVLPLVAVGVAVLLARVEPWLRRNPLAAPAAALVFLVAWNLGFITIFRTGTHPGTMPLEDLAREEGRLLRRATEALGAIAGPRGRAFAYGVFKAEYLYTAFNPGGTIAPASDDAPLRYLLRGWATRGRRGEGPEFRWAASPEACVRVPLDQPFDMPIAVLAFAPRGATPQTMTVAVNGTTVGAATLTPEWQDLPFRIAARDLVPGENELCLRFDHSLPEREGVRIAAGVSRIQLP